MKKFKKKVDDLYFIFDPEYKIGGMFSMVLPVKGRAPKDILNELKETICDDLDNFIKCKDLNIEVKIEWKFATNRVDID